MTVLNFFKFLEDKEDRAIPPRARLALDPDYVFDVKDFEDKDGNVRLSGNPNIISIPTNNLTVKGYLELADCRKLQSLPNNLIVGDYLDLSFCINLQSLPDNLNVGRQIYLKGCKSLRSLPDNLTRVKGSFDLRECENLQSLPDNLTVGGHLDLSFCKSLQSLPDNLTVHDVYLDYTSIETLPKDLKIHGNIFMYNTPLSKKYTEEEIRQMCPGIKGDIYGAKGAKTTNIFTN